MSSALNSLASDRVSVASDGLWFGKDLSTPEPIPEDAIERAVELMRSGRLHRYGEQGTGYPEPSLLEQEYAAYVGSKYCVAVSSCGAAMFIALKALGVKPGDKVLTSTFTLSPVPGAIAHAGADAILVETSANYMTDMADLERKAATSGAKVFLLSHMRGHIADLQAIRAVCDQYGIAIIEDCAQSHGARLNGQMAGTLGDASAFSFYPTKNLGAYGDGGLCASHDEKLIAECKKVRMYGFEQTYCSVREGLNSRLDELQAAVLNVKLPHLADWVNRRREIATWYDESLPGQLQRMVPNQGVDHAYHLYVVRSSQRDRLRAALSSMGVGTGIHYPHPIHRMPGYEWMGMGEGSLPVTEMLAREVLSLPMYPELGRERAQLVIDAVNRAVSELS